MIIAMDFDGTLCTESFPEIGEPLYPRIEFCKKLKAQGHKLILWTCRTGKTLDDAVLWCKKHGLTFDSVNCNLPEIQEKWGGDTRKIYCDYYVDDKNISFRELHEKTFPL